MLSAAAFFVAVISPTASPTGEVPSEPIAWSVAFSVTVLVLFAFRHMYTPPLRLDVLDSMRLVFAETALAVALTMVARVVITNQPYVAAETVRHWVPAVLLLAAGRTGVLWLEARGRTLGGESRATLIVGAGRIGRLTARRLLEEPELGLRPVVFLDDDPLEADEKTAAIPVLPLDHDLEQLVSRYGVSNVIVAFSMASHDRLLALSKQCWTLGLSVAMVPRLFEMEGESVVTEHLGGLPLIEIRRRDPKGWQFRVKYGLDRVISGIALVALLPVLAAAALAVRISLGSPALFRQRRVGLDGHAFDMLKFRTLAPAPANTAANAEWAAQQSGREPVVAHTPMDQRSTRVGRTLRRFAIDELPQLWNVFRGDMSLIGPRPERVAYVERFNATMYRYDDRHRVKSGLTGWAQIHGLQGSTSLADRIEWDNHYIEHWSLWMDFKIVVKTFPALLRGLHD